MNEWRFWVGKIEKMLNKFEFKNLEQLVQAIGCDIVHYPMDVESHQRVKIRGILDSKILGNIRTAISPIQYKCIVSSQTTEHVAF